MIAELQSTDTNHTLTKYLQPPPRDTVRALRGAAGQAGRAVQREDLQGGGDVLQGRPADGGGDVQQRGGRPRLQRVPRPHRAAGATEGI